MYNQPVNSDPIGLDDYSCDTLVFNILKSELRDESCNSVHKKWANYNVIKTYRTDEILKKIEELKNLVTDKEKRSEVLKLK